MSSILISFVELTFFLSLCHGFVIDKVERTVDISSQLTRITSLINIKNYDISTPFILVSDQSRSKLAYMSVTSDGKDLVVERPPNSDSEYRHFSVKLKKKSAQLTVLEVYTDALKPYPQEIAQSESQFVVYRGSHYLISPYKVTSQTTNVKLASTKVESYTKLKPSQLTGSTVKFGPYSNVAPYTVSELVVHSENNSPFLVVSQLERLIEVSHWGRISIEEVIDIHHNGAGLRGTFSRLDYQRDQTGGRSSIDSFETSLPASASDVYYRDDIGNISTSNLRRMTDEVSLELRPRFPLFGGWGTHYMIGYKLPVYEYLYRKNNHFALKIRFLDHVFDNIWVKKMTVKLLLPEGVTNVRVQTPFSVQRHPDSLFATYLDTTGRVVVSMSKGDLVDEHIQDLVVEYDFPTWLMAREPLMLIGALMLVFSCVVVYTRLDFRLDASDGSAGCQRLAAVCGRLLTLHRGCCSSFQRLENAVDAAKLSRDAKPLHAVLEAEKPALEKNTSTMAGLVESLREEDAASHSRLSELIKHEVELRALFIQHAALVNRLASGNLNRNTFIDQEQPVVKKKTDLAHKLEDMTSSL